MTRRRIAIVTPWYGPEATGGAETLARELASHLSGSDDVTIVTTTARSFHADWSENYFKAGRTKENGYTVLRFPLGDRNDEQFHRLNGELMGRPRSSWNALARQRARMEPFIDESINSPLLEDYLRGSEAAKYHAVVFLPYLYGIVVRGIAAFPGRAHLIPCLHDEVYARLPRIEDAVHRAATLLFNSDGEAELALRMYGPGIIHKSRVIGTGVTLSATAAGSSGVSGPYFLYLGRRDETKGIEFLIDAFSEFRRTVNARYSLVLAGPGNTSYHNAGRGIVDLGFVDEGTKRALIRDARALAQPSLNESYSRVMMEAWRESVPVIARSECLATSIAVQRSGGGLIAEGLAGWTHALSHLAGASPAELADFGRLGSLYAAEHSDWSFVVERFRDATGLGSLGVSPARGKRIDQVIETMSYGDAISDYARTLQAHLRSRGHDGNIYARVIHPRVIDKAEPIWTAAFAPADALIYHHSIAFDDIEIVRSAPGTKALIYHNITPARFFRDYDLTFAEHLDRGRTQLGQLTHTFQASAAVSEFNAHELRDLGFEDVAVVPVPINFARFDVTPAEIARTEVGAQWLFVGRVSPNKGLHQLLEAFEAYVCLDPFARLILVGGYSPGDRYFQELSQFVFERSLEPNVVFAGLIDEATLTAHYRNADLYVCLSQHEGFCVPLVEAMFFDIPIVASANTAIVETLGDAGILVDPSADPVEIALVAREIRSDEELRKRIVDSQRMRRVAFRPDQVFPIVDAFIAEIA